MMNQGESFTELSFDFSQVPGLAPCGNMGCGVRDVWARADLGSFAATFAATVSSHDAAFLIVSA